MSNSNDSKFSTGFLLGLILGGGLVFLLGTKTGKNLLKIVSEQGLDGIVSLLEEYNFNDLGEYEEVDLEEDADIEEHHEDTENDESDSEKSKPGKKRFFKRIRK